MANKNLNAKLFINFTDSSGTGEDLYLISGENLSTSFGKINKYIKDNTIVSSWKMLQNKVRANNMSDISIGDQYTCSQGSSSLTWDVIGKNIDTPANSNLSHTLTLRTHFVLSDTMKFSGPEALYACQTEVLNAGTYYFSEYDEGWEKYNYYQFTITQQVPVGGQLVYDDYNSVILTYASSSNRTPIETVSVSNKHTGINLGEIYYSTCNGNFNAFGRLYDSNNWKESAIRQWLNSDKPAGEWWSPQNPWDRPPNEVSTMNGFMYDLDPDFKSVIGKTQITTKYLNIITGAIDSTYTTDDYFFLLSTSQISSDYSGEGSKYTPYSNDASRIVSDINGQRRYYKLRSPFLDLTDLVPDIIMVVTSSGTISDNGETGNTTTYVTLTCNII